MPLNYKLFTKHYAWWILDLEITLYIKVTWVFVPKKKKKHFTSSMSFKATNISPF